MSADSTKSSEHGSPAPSPEVLSRRSFLNLLTLGLGALGGLLVGAPLTGFVVAPLFEGTEPIWRDVGAEGDFPVGSTIYVKFKDSTALPWSGVTAESAAWLRRETETEVIAFSVNCAHLGCPVRWLDDANLFMCPCHGGVYYRDGEVAAGPPPAPLQRYPARIQAGRVEVQAMPLPLVTAQRPGRCHTA